MPGTTALFHVTESTPDSVIAQAAEGAAVDDTHLAVSVWRILPTLPPNALGAMPYGGINLPDNWPEMLKSARDGLLAKVETVKGLLANAGASGEVRPCFNAFSDIESQSSTLARTADIAYFASNLRTEEDALMREILHGVLFHAPIPAMLNAAPGHQPNNIVVAWDDGLAAARAAHLALPFLKAADKVTVVSFDLPARSDNRDYEPGAALSAWLSHHGCAVTLAHYPSGGQEIGECLTNRARELGADLVVMGAYGHSRLRQAVFGGTTRGLIEQSTMRLLMAH